MFTGNFRLLLVCKMEINHVVWLNALRKSFSVKRNSVIRNCWKTTQMSFTLADLKLRYEMFIKYHIIDVLP